MIREQRLFESPLVLIARYDHPPGRDHQDPDEEIASAHAVSFVERGDFELRRGRHATPMTPGALMMTRPGLAYSCRHARRVPGDLCLAVIPSASLVESIASSGSGRLESIPSTPRAANRATYHFLRLRDRLEPRDSAASPAGIEALALELLGAVAAGDERAARPFRLSQVAWYRPRVDAARERIHQTFQRPHTLASLSAEAGMSPFHFARVFAELTGSPPHRYLVRVRLEAARRRLQDGAGVSETALLCGFSNLSHFIRSFRRRFGVTPSSVRSARA